MGKKVNSVFMAVVFVCLTAFLAVEGADAFCVYNNSDRQVHFKQTFGGQYDNAGYPGGSDCCDWKRSECNEGGKIDSVVKFTVTSYYRSGGFITTQLVCEDFPIEAGGKLVVEGKDGHYWCSKGDRIK